ncbi:MAG: hypothetical protein H6713_01855 [Myxococcales bacterium]|nr:hypothetical protein [Myxococcales bacterium]
MTRGARTTALLLAALFVSAGCRAHADAAREASVEAPAGGPAAPVAGERELADRGGEDDAVDGDAVEDDASRPAEGDAGAATAPRGPEITLKVSPNMRERLVPIEREVYEQGEIGPLFGLLRERSAGLCRYLHGLEALDEGAVAAYVNPPDRFARRKLGEKWSLMAGCWNYVRLNDRRPHRDFDLVRRMFPAEDGYDCYAVGVVQPYLMSERLGCRELTMIDFDWQIHAIHWQLLEAWGGGGLARERLDATLAGLRIDWIAYHEPQEQHEASLESLCHAGFAERCRATFDAFSSRQRDEGLRRITLALAALHELELSAPEAGDRVPVVFLSNATEKHFMTRSEFRQLLQRVSASLLPGQRAALIHHVAGSPALGVYELTPKTGGGYKVRTRCRDEYVKGTGTGPRTSYETWFEEIASGDESARACTPTLGASK